MKRHRAFSLIEVVMVMTVGFILLGFGAKMLVLLMRLDRTQRTRSSEEAKLDRLARQFRKDVAFALPGDVPRKDELAQGKLDLKQTSGAFVRYRVEKEALVRTEDRGKAAPARDRYELNGASAPRLEIEMQGPVALLRIRWGRDGGQSQTGRRLSFTIEAALGRYAQFAVKEGADDAKAQ